ncbi:MFS transporter [Rhodococcus xishaensis]|uniref:MFS transporter n=1 Tax=Rhodococcus xishaensis TaxID=2487364 RepID=A0A438AZ75_9NOCA|nr:MFS transporter [Rhodococcus xishaensis]RVW04003.1 MFS transporter [Rhodococcus xishaensis]
MLDTRPVNRNANTLSRARTSAAVAFGLQGFMLAALLTQLPQFKDDLGFSDSLVVGAVVGVSIVAGVGSVVAEQLAKATSSRTTLRVGLLVIAAAAVVIAFASSTTAFLAAFAFYGIGLGMVDAAANMQAVSIQHAYGRVILSSFHAAWSVGAILGALFVSACSGLGLSVEVCVVTAAVVVAIGCLAIGPRLLHTGHQRTSDAPAGPLSVPLWPFLALGVAMVLFYAIDFGIANWSALYLKEVLLSDVSTAALAMAAYQITALISRLTGDFWVRRFGEIAVVRAGAAVSVVGLLVVVLAQAPAVAIIGFFVVGLGVPVVAPLCFSAAGRLAPPDQTDAVIARINMFNYAGTVIGGAVIGGMAWATDLRIGFVAPLLFAAALFLLAPAFAPRQVSPAAPEAESTSSAS